VTGAALLADVGPPGSLVRSLASMPDAATLQPWAVSRTLWLVLLFPILGLAAQAILVGHRAVWGGWARPIAMSTSGLSLACVAAHAVMLAKASSGRILLCHVAQALNLGSLSSSLDLQLDALGAAASLLATLVALLACLFVQEVAGFAWIHLALLGALVEFLADDVLPLAMSGSLAAMAIAWLAMREGASAAAATAVRSAAGVWAIGVGIALILGGPGAWDGATNEAVHAFEATPVAYGPVAPPDGASLSMSFPAGASVFVDDARTPVARAPFEGVTLAAGTHLLRVRTGARAQDEAVGPLSVGAGQALVLLPAGPVSSLHGMDELRAAAGEPHGAEPRVIAVLVAWLVAAAALSVWPLPNQSSPALAAVACVTTSVAGPFLLLRASQAFSVPREMALLFVAGGAFAFLAVLRRALSLDGPARWLSFAAGAPAGLSTLALGRGSTLAGERVMLAGAFLASAIHLCCVRRLGAPEATSREPEPPSPESLFLSVPARLGGLLLSMDRWVVGTAVDAAASAARAAGWVVAWQDEHAIGMPGNAAARRITAVGRSVEPLVGAPVGRVIWWLLGVAGACLLARGLLPGVR
jgi:hypothetical protein